MAIAVALLVLGLLGFAICLYFLSLLYPLPARLTRLLSGTAKACGIDGGSCKRVVQTPYANIFAGAPNVIVGTVWSVALLVLTVVFLVTGTFPLYPYAFAVALASVGVGVYLTIVLFFVLRDP